MIKVEPVHLWGGFKKIRERCSGHHDEEAVLTIVCEERKFHVCLCCANHLAANLETLAAETLSEESQT